MKYSFFPLPRAMALLAIASATLHCTSSATPFEFENRNAVYSQDFSHLDVSGSGGYAKEWVDDVTVPHWRARVADAPASIYNVTHGSSGASGLQVWHMQDGTNRRALGMLTDITNRNVLLAFGMLNSTGATIDEVTIEFMQAQWYGGTAAAIDKMTFSYRPNYSSHTGGTWLLFPELDLDGFVNGPGGLADPIFTEKGATLTGLDWQPGEQLWIRWVDLRASGGNAGAGFASFRVSLPGGDAASSFVQWQADHFSSEELGDDSVSGPAADPGGFGIPNVLRYLLGLDPRQPEISDLPVATTGPGDGENDIVFAFTRIADAADVDSTVETSADLQEWQTVPSEQIEILPADPGMEKLTVRETVDTADRQFFRIRASLLD